MVSWVTKALEQLQAGAGALLWRGRISCGVPIASVLPAAFGRAWTHVDPQSDASRIASADRVLDHLQPCPERTSSSRSKASIYTSPNLISFVQGFRKYSHALSPEALQLVEDVCDGLDDGQAQQEVEKLAREYNMQEGASGSS